MKLQEVFTHTTAKVGTKNHSATYKYEHGRHREYKSAHALITELDNGARKVRAQAVKLLNLQPLNTCYNFSMRGPRAFYFYLSFKPSDEALEFNRQMAEQLLRKLVSMYMPDFEIEPNVSMHDNSMMAELKLKSPQSARGRMITAAIGTTWLSEKHKRSEMKWW